MDTKFQTSFIPKKQITDTGPVRSQGVSFFTIIALFLFVISLAMAVGTFFYKTVLTNRIKYQNDQIALDKKELDSSTIQTYSRLSNRIKGVTDILHNHKEYSLIFATIANNTLPSVSFTDFNLSSGSGAGKLTLTMHGQATSYEAIALQAQAFSDPKLKNFFRNAVFSGLDAGAENSFIFNFTADVDQNQLLYYSANSSANTNNTATSNTTNSTTGTVASQNGVVASTTSTTTGAFIPLPSNK